MRELIKKSLLVGIGAASITKSKADKLVKEFVRKRALTTKDAKTILNAVMKEINHQKQKLKRMGKIRGDELKRKAIKVSRELERLGKSQARKILRIVEKELK